MLAFFGFIFLYAQRVGMSVAIVCMVNQTAVRALRDAEMSGGDVETLNNQTSQVRSQFYKTERVRFWVTKFGVHLLFDMSLRLINLSLTQTGDRPLSRYCEPFFSRLKVHAYCPTY